nr:hypothetical protein CFP56_71795 [Quercus suber]
MRAPSSLTIQIKILTPLRLSYDLLIAAVVARCLTKALFTITKQLRSPTKHGSQANLRFLYSSSLYTNSNWFAFEDDRVANERSTSSLASPLPNTEVNGVINGGSDDNAIVGEDDDLVDTATPSPEAGTKSEGTTHLDNSRETRHAETDKQPEWFEWRETTDSGDPSDVLPNGEIQVGLELSEADAAEASLSTVDWKKMMKQLLDICLNQQMKTRVLILMRI